MVQICASMLLELDPQLVSNAIGVPTAAGGEGEEGGGDGGASIMCVMYASA